VGTPTLATHSWPNSRSRVEDDSRSAASTAEGGVSDECRKLRCKLLFPNKLRITGDFGPWPASRAAPVEGPKNARPWWGRAIRSVAFRDGRLCRKTTCA